MIAARLQVGRDAVCDLRGIRRWVFIQTCVSLEPNQTLPAEHQSRRTKASGIVNVRVSPSSKLPVAQPPRWMMDTATGYQTLGKEENCHPHAHRAALVLFCDSCCFERRLILLSQIDAPHQSLHLCRRLLCSHRQSLQKVRILLRSQIDPALHSLH